MVKPNARPGWLHRLFGRTDGGKSKKKRRPTAGAERAGRVAAESETSGPLAELASHGLRLAAHRAVIEDFRITVKGSILDPARPGLVHRIVFSMGGEELGSTLAREPEKGGRPPGAGHFSCTFPVPERLLDSGLTLRVVGSPAEFALRPRLLVPNTGGAPAEDRPPEPIRPDDQITGRVGAATTATVSGWALCERTRSAEGLELILLVDDRPVAAARCVHPRADAAKKFGARGPVGFQFHLPANLWTGTPLRYQVVPATGVNGIQNGAGTLDPPAGRWVPSPMPVPRAADAAPPGSPGSPKISVIILNRNGHGVLRDLLVSAERCGDLGRAEWIVVDHQSLDESEALCSAFRAAGNDVRFLARNGNFTFSASNNFGAAEATGDVLVFANNDLVFPGPVLERAAARLEDAAVGILGAELLDHVAAPAWQDRLPVQHDGVFVKPFSEGPYLRPFEARACPDLAEESGRRDRPAVTAAFVAMRRADFEAIGGFDEGYEYGLEDVDLCFRVAVQLGKSAVVDRGLRVIHRQGFSREADAALRARRVRNNELFNARWGHWLRRSIRHAPLAGRSFWFGRRPIVAFTVTDTEDAGDYLTALELGHAIQEVADVHLVYRGRDEWTDLAGIDVLINMSPYFNLDEVTGINPFITTINWIRQWFDRWAESGSLGSYDFTLASSDNAARYLADRTAVAAEVMPIAANLEKMAAGTRREDYASDYCFNGGSFGVRREIEYDLDVAAVRGRGRIFGKGWEATPLAPIAFGALPYREMPDVYASTRIVIDDGVFATAHWGSCNSRVFDALAAGCLVVTNNAIGARELFGDLLPVYQGREELTRLLNYWLEHEAERQERVDRLREIVRARHGYRNRADQVLGLLSRPPGTRIAIKCPAPQDEPEAWGDYHFAQSLARSLRRGGATVRIDLREARNNAIADTDEVVIVLRGTVPYKRRANQLSILWLISHPNEVSAAEIDSYDHVYVASAIDAERLASRSEASISFLPQCTDTSRFTFDPDVIRTRGDRILFVGNSRAIFRDSVRWSIEHGLDIDVYGQGWEPFLRDNRLKGLNVPNDVLGALYASSGVVLCDHWADMARMGYLSNRAFDVLAVGGRLVTDPVAGIESLLPEGSYEIFRNGAELAAIARSAPRSSLEDRREWAAWVREHHSFDARAKEILALVAERLGARPALGSPHGHDSFASSSLVG